MNNVHIIFVPTTKIQNIAPALDTYCWILHMTNLDAVIIAQPAKFVPNCNPFDFQAQHLYQNKINLY